MPLSRRRITEPEALKALAHPTRLALLDLLVVDGPKTASEAAAVIGGSPANASWHLRKLAEHGFLREVTGRKGRARPWRAVSEGLTWGEADHHAEATAIGEGLTDVLLEREMQRFRAARAALATEPAQWRDASSLSQSALWLTAEEATELVDGLRDLFLSKAARLHDPELRPEGARLLSLVAWVAPYGPIEPPAQVEPDVATATSAAPAAGGPGPASPPGPVSWPPPE